MSFLKKHKYHLYTLGIIVIIMLISGYFAFLAKENTEYRIQNVENTNTSTEQILNKNETNIKEIIDEDKTNADDNIQYPNITISKTTKQKEVDGSGINEHTIRQLDNLTISDEDVEGKIIHPIDTKLIINGTPYEADLPENSSTLDLMNKLAENNDFSFSGKNYSGLGFFVDEINGIKNDNKTNKFWIYYINGESAKIGISNYIIQSNDIIEWKYEESKF